ncbi:MAG: hypothetical protein JO256_04085 [Alphaproteobacteria bacterium]|nr:hypothetical protein [Alphaproteobacteria bacterium]
MEIHKPKPIHNWRDFLKEVGTIVIGVSIALAGEQAVEKWRQHRQYLEARDAMRDELAGDIANLSSRRDSERNACSARRITEITAILDKAEKQQPFTPPSWIGQSLSPRLRFSAESEAGRSELFSGREQALFSYFYSFLHSIDLEQDRERQAWARLQALEGRSSLSPEMIANLRQALAEARWEAERIQYLLVFLTPAIKTLSLPSGTTLSGVGIAFRLETPPLCLPLATPREEAIRRTTPQAAK